MKTNISFVIGLILSATIPLAKAAPRKYSGCPVFNKIKTPPNAANVFMSEDCKTAYVLPPESGEVDITGYVDELGMSGELCNILNGNLQEINRNLNQAKAELDFAQNKLSELDSDARENRNKCVELEVAASTAEQKLKDNQAAQETERAKIAKIDEQLKTCSGVSCNDLNNQRALSNDKLELLKIRESGLDSSFQRTATRRNTCQVEQTRVARRITDDVTQYQAKLQPLTDKITSLTRSGKELFEAQRVDAGAQLSFKISSEQTSLVNQFRKLNQSLDVQFTEMPLSDVALSFTQVHDGVADGYPIILKSNINGVTLGADNSFHTVPFSSTGGNQQVIFGAAVGGSMTINRFSACQMPRSSSVGSSTAGRTRLKEIAASLGATATYRYQLGVSRKIKINYNEKQLYCLIKKNSTSNGLFHSSSSSSITETSQLNQWLTIAIESEDSGFDFADRETLLMDLRSEMLDRALMNVATSYLSKERSQLIAPGEVGAGRIAGQLRKCPNMYCQFGAILLDLGNSLFGGTDSSSSTCENVGAMSVQNFEDTKPVPAYGTQAFKISGAKGN